MNPSLRQAIGLNIAYYLQSGRNYRESDPYLASYLESLKTTSPTINKRINAAQMLYRSDSARGTFSPPCSGTGSSRT